MARAKDEWDPDRLRDRLLVAVVKLRDPDLAAGRESSSVTRPWSMAEGFWAWGSLALFAAWNVPVALWAIVSGYAAAGAVMLGLVAIGLSRNVAQLVLAQRRASRAPTARPPLV